MTVVYMWSSDVKVKLVIKIVITKAEEFQTSRTQSQLVCSFQSQGVLGKTFKMSYGHVRYLRNCPNSGLLHYFSERTRKMGKKRVLFTFWPITPMPKFLRGIQKSHMKADVLAIPKMW